MRLRWQAHRGGGDKGLQPRHEVGKITSAEKSYTSSSALSRDGVYRRNGRQDVPTSISGARSACLRSAIKTRFQRTQNKPWEQNNTNRQVNSLWMEPGTRSFLARRSLSHALHVQVCRSFPPSVARGVFRLPLTTTTQPLRLSAPTPRRCDGSEEGRQVRRESHTEKDSGKDDGSARSQPRRRV